MRHCLCAILLTCVLGFGTLMAGDLATVQVQQLVTAAQGAAQGGSPIDVPVSIDGKTVIFKVSRDAVGNVTARPVPGPDSAGITVSQVTIQMKADAKGVLIPTSMIVVGNNQTITSYSVQLTDDGSIASLYQAGVGGAGGTGGTAQAKPIVGGIGGGAGTSGRLAGLPGDIFPGFTSAQLGLPAGAESGSRAASASQP